MSYKNSNLYASRVFAEHPVALWAIDEDFYFSSLISESEKTINSENWDVLNGSVVTNFISPSERPIEDSNVAKIFLSSSTQFSVQISGNDISYVDTIDNEKDSACINFFVYIPDESNIDSIESGFYINGEYYLKSRTISPIDYNKWIKIESTVDIFSEDDLKPVIFINFNNTSINNEANSSIFISGLSIGQWSESFNSENTGTIVSSIPETIKDLISEEYSSLITGLEIDPYGLSNEDIGYVIKYRKRILAETSGIPMIYGSKNNISIFQRKFEDAGTVLNLKKFLPLQRKLTCLNHGGSLRWKIF
jgi:hypothetical protein